MVSSNTITRLGNHGTAGMFPTTIGQSRSVNEVSQMAPSAPATPPPPAAYQRRLAMRGRVNAGPDIGVFARIVTRSSDTPADRRAFTARPAVCWSSYNAYTALMRASHPDD